MSFFDSLLASVGGNGAATSASAPTVQPAKINSRPVKISSNTITNTGTVLKRKADGELVTSIAKSQKTSDATEGNSANLTTKPVPSSLTKLTSNNTADSSSTKLSSRATVIPKTNAGSKPPLSRPPVSAHQPAPGSLAELLARAKSMQTTKLGQGGGLTNRSTTKSKEEAKENRKKLLDARKSKGPLSKAKVASRSGSEGPPAHKKMAGSKKSLVEEKPKRKPVEVSYKGTMRGPAPSTYQGSANLKATGNARKDDRYRSSSDRYRREYSESAEEDEEEYDSAGSSDMEAGAWDIDEEEEVALRVARKEDAREQKLEEELKRKKLLRKQGFGR